MALTDKDTIEKFLVTDIDATYDTFVTFIIGAVKNYIEKYTGKEFEGTTEARYFDGNGKRELVVDEFTTLTAVNVLDTYGNNEYALTEGQAADYITYPYNGTPKFKLILVSTATVGSFLKGHKRVKITGTWGEATTVPNDIKLAATMLAGQIVKEGRDGGKIQSESLGDYSVTFASVEATADRIGVKNILDRYKIIELV